ncbi:MAG: FAD-dependent oxidoreductase [Oscillospiraceae bacterium]
MKIVIVGGVAGGATAAGRIRRLNENAEIILLERGEYISFANCGLPYYVGGVIKDREALLVQTPETFGSRYNLDVRIQNEVIAIDRKGKTLEILNRKTGESYRESYDKLLLSTGAEPIRPPMEGTELPEVFTLRTVPDTLAIREFIVERKPKSAVVVGGGFIGLEMVENLAENGIAVTLVEKSSQVAPNLDGDIVAEVHDYLRKKGIDLRLEETLDGIAKEDGRLKVNLEGGDTVSADMVLLSIGVRPENRLAVDAGLEVGIKGTVVTDTHMRTSDPDIYAVGDMVQIIHPVSGEPVSIPLAGPANKQARIAADNLCGIESEYAGAQGSAVLKLFDMTVASTGLGIDAAKAAGFECDFTIVHAVSHAGYYPGAEDLTLKVIFETSTGRILGAQVVGFDGVDKRCDVLATAIRGGMTALDLTELDLCYAPPYSSTRDPVNVAAYVIENMREGTFKQFHWDAVDQLPRDGSVTLLDVRSREEYAQGHVDDFINIPMDALRTRFGELDIEKPVYIYCLGGLRSYVASRILTAKGYDAYSLCGGWKLYSSVKDDRKK